MYGTKPDGGTWQDDQRARSAVVAQEQRARLLEKYQNATRLPGLELPTSVSEPTIFEAMKSLLQRGVPVAVLMPLLLAACGEAQATPGGPGAPLEPTRPAIVGAVHDPSRGSFEPTVTIAGTAVPAAPTREPTATPIATATTKPETPTPVATVAPTTRPAAPATPGTPEVKGTPGVPAEIASNPFLAELYNKNGEGIPMLEIEGKEPIKAELDLHLKRYVYKDKTTGEILAAYDHGPFPKIVEISYIESSTGKRIMIGVDNNLPFKLNFDTSKVDKAALDALLSQMSTNELFIVVEEYGDRAPNDIISVIKDLQIDPVYAGVYMATTPGPKDRSNLNADFVRYVVNSGDSSQLGSVRNQAFRGTYLTDPYIYGLVSLADVSTTLGFTVSPTASKINQASLNGAGVFLQVVAK